MKFPAGGFRAPCTALRRAYRARCTVAHRCGGALLPLRGAGRRRRPAQHGHIRMLLREDLATTGSEGEAGRPAR